jgi:hypothetical protein
VKFEKIKTVTDKSSFEKIFYTYFINSKVYLKLEGGNIAVKFFGYTHGQVAFKITQLKNVPDECLMVAVTGKYTIHLSLRFIEKEEDNVFIFEPIRFQFIGTDQQGSDTDDGKKLVYITSIISDFIIQNTIVQRIKKVDTIKEQIFDEIENAFDYYRIYLCNEGPDVRMKYFLDQRTALFIPDFQKPDKKLEKLVNFYLNSIYAKDNVLKNKREIISEISVPFLYQGKMPYGYLQVNGKSPFGESTLSSVKKLTIHIDELFMNNNIFYKTPEKFIVNRLWKTGFGIVFKERKYIRYFKDKSLVYCDMMLPGNKRVSMLSEVSDISILPNKTITVGFEIQEMDALGEVSYDEYVQSIKK